MRVATTTLFSVSRSGLKQHQADQVKLQEQLSSGRRLLTPSDDPIASARALVIGQSSAINGQYSTNSQSADAALRTSESVLNQVTSLIQNVQTLAVNAGNPGLATAEKKILESELRAKYNELLGLANSTDATGVYLFSGFQGGTQPFSETSFGNVTYNGDEGVRKIQISTGRQIPISESGTDVFQRIKNGNGTFVSTPDAANLGTGINNTGQVVDVTKWNAAAPQDYQIQFYWQPNPAKPAEPLITYDLVDNNTGNSLIDGAVSAGKTAGPRSYVAGGDIEFKQLAGEVAVPAWDYGIKMNVTGKPIGIDPATGAPSGAAGAADSFNLTASSNVDIFSTLGDFSSALSAYNTDATGKSQTEFQNALNTAMLNLSNALTNVLTVQASIGARMNETESVQNTASDLKLQYQKTLSSLTDLDYVSAISDFSMNQMLLDATRSSFSKVQDLSLFKYIN